jgi:hypothetical protein
MQSTACAHASMAAGKGQRHVCKLNHVGMGSSRIVLAYALTTPSA